MVKGTVDGTVMDNVHAYIEKVSAHYNVDAAFLFGSYARGMESKDSDIDVAVVSNDFCDVIEDGARLIGLTWKIDTRIEPHPITKDDYENISTPFIKEIRNTGIRVAGDMMDG